MKFLMYGDAHFRSTVPEARLDDYLQNQENLIAWLFTEFPDHFHLFSGDLVHVARERAEPLTFVNYLISKIQKPIYGVYGNHDLLYHSIDTIDKTAVGTLELVGKFVPIPETGMEITDEDGNKIHIYGFHYGKEIQHLPSSKNDFTAIAVYHGMVMQQPNSFIEGVLAETLLTEFPEYDIILTGDNHKGFAVSNKERIVINPGSLKRDNADQMEHTPHVYEYDTITKNIRAIPVPIENDIISQDHLVLEKERDLRIEALSSKFSEVRDITLDYHENLMEFMKQNNTLKAVEEIIYSWMM